MREPFELCAYWLSWILACALFVVGLVAILAGIVWAGDWIVTTAGLA